MEVKALKFVEGMDIRFREFETLRSLLAERTAIEDICDEIRPLMDAQAHKIKELAEAGNVKEIIPAWSKLDTLSLWYHWCVGL